MSETSCLDSTPQVPSVLRVLYHVHQPFKPTLQPSTEQLKRRPPLPPFPPPPSGIFTPALTPPSIRDFYHFFRVGLPASPPSAETARVDSQSEAALFPAGGYRQRGRARVRRPSGLAPSPPQLVTSPAGKTGGIFGCLAVGVGPSELAPRGVEAGSGRSTPDCVKTPPLAAGTVPGLRTAYRAVQPCSLG